MPLPAFIMLLFVILLIVAAAVVVPLELLVFNKPKTSTSVSDAQTSLSQCQATTTCANGGTNIVTTSSTGDACACICVNGFTGSDCTVLGSLGCTTATIAGNSSSDTVSTFSNATLGEAIPRLVSQAQANFSIPLVGETILARFNTGGLSCDAENALVTFDGSNSRTGKAVSKVSSSATAGITAAAVRHRAVKRDEKRAAIELDARSDPDTTITESSTLIVSTGNSALIGTSTSFLTSTSAYPTQLQVASSTTVKTTSSPSPTSTSALFVVSEEVLDFARVSVLYVLQQQKLDNAVTAQTALQKFFSLAAASRTQAAAKSLSLGNGNTVDLVLGTINAGNGTVGAGKGIVKRWVLMGVVDFKATVMHGGGD